MTRLANVNWGLATGEGLRHVDLAGMRAALIGCAVGDALGVPYEFRKRGTFCVRDMEGHGTHDQPAGTWSDDTSLTLATVHSVLRLGRVDPDDLRHEFALWLWEGAHSPDGMVFDVGLATREALACGAGMDSEGSQGNGSLMRISPLAFTDATPPDVWAASAVTHAHPTCCMACASWVDMLRRAADAPDFWSRELDPWRQVDERDVRSGGWVVDTLRASLWCVANASGFRQAVMLAVNLGDDTGTTAACVGAMAATLWGLDDIPGEWLHDLRGMELLQAPFDTYGSAW